MPKFFPQVFITGVVLFLLLGAGYGITQAARAIPWDCADWQAFAHEDRTTVILESLAENRGKTLYCGVDQSDTFTKAETWAAGKDRNERDDTIYSGERGIFRGFIAAQEGYLTDGESGVTGVSIDRIFEFPREKRRRGWKTKRLTIPPDLERRVYTNWGQQTGDFDIRNSGWMASAHAQARTRFATPFGGGAGISYNWQTLSEPPAMAACRDRGAKFVEVTPSSDNSGGWEYIADLNPGVNWYSTQARKTNTWTAVCKKRVRRTRR